MESGLPSFPQGFTCPVVLRIPLRLPEPFAYRSVTFCGGAFQPLRLDPDNTTFAVLQPRASDLTPSPRQNPSGGSSPLPAEAEMLCSSCRPDCLFPEALALLAIKPATEGLKSLARFGLFPVRSPLLGESRLISLPPGTEMFHFPGFALPPYVFRRQFLGFTQEGFPHSDTHGSTLARSSPWLFAACHVLLRQPMPSHPPYALSVLTHIPFSKNKEKEQSFPWEDFPFSSKTISRPLSFLRKEVIQPQVPLRLPCYDFTPITCHTLDGCPPLGVGPPASGTADFRGVTGGVYKARERIHRGMADPRLLAIPRSRSRVADSDPN